MLIKTIIEDPFFEHHFIFKVSSMIVKKSFVRFLTRNSYVFIRGQIDKLIFAEKKLGYRFLCWKFFFTNLLNTFFSY